LRRLAVKAECPAAFAFHFARVPGSISPRLANRFYDRKFSNVLARRHSPPPDPSGRVMMAMRGNRNPATAKQCKPF
jgi:hypothetical protein